MPSCGAQNFLRLGAPKNFDRCAIFYSLYLLQAALIKNARAVGARVREFAVKTETALNLISAVYLRKDYKIDVFTGL